MANEIIYNPRLDRIPFVSFPDRNAPAFDYANAREVQRVDLREIPLESVIEFWGVHTISIYLCKVTEAAPEDRKIKIWFNRLANCAVGSIDSILSIDLKKNQPGADEATFVERAVMEVGKLYMMPTFDHPWHDGRYSTVLNHSASRGEGYTRILLQMPEVT